MELYPNSQSALLLQSSGLYRRENMKTPLLLKQQIAPGVKNKPLSVLSAHLTYTLELSRVQGVSLKRIFTQIQVSAPKMQRGTRSKKMASPNLSQSAPLTKGFEHSLKEAGGVLFNVASPFFRNQFYEPSCQRKLG